MPLVICIYGLCAFVSIGFFGINWSSYSDKRQPLLGFMLALIPLINAVLAIVTTYQAFEQTFKK